jgi:hypothetical protein
MEQRLNSYELSRVFFNWAFDNPEKIKPIHSAIYFFSIEHCNRLGWKQKFGLPSQMVMEAIGVKNWRTYSKGLSDLVDFGFIKMVETSKNQYSANIIAIVKNTKAPTKALDKALSKHLQKQSQSIVSIDKQYNKEQRTIKQEDIEYIYSLYPTTCPYRNRSTSKSKSKNIKQIKTILKEISFSDFKRIISGYQVNTEISNQNNDFKVGLKNFTTFLNNIPSIEDLEKEYLEIISNKANRVESKEEAYERKLKDSRTNR